MGIRRQFLYIFYWIITNESSTSQLYSHDGDKSTCKMCVAYLLDVLGFLCPGAGFPLGFQVSVFPCLAHVTGWCVVWELQSELGQLQVVQAVCLTWNAGFWAIDQHLHLMEGNMIEMLELIQIRIGWMDVDRISKKSIIILSVT